MHTGRSRYKTHAGIPHGSTNNLGSNLALYYQWKENCLVARWDDQSPNGRHAAQSNAAQQASISDDGSLDFEADNANHYDFTDVNIAGSEGFIVFLVINLESKETKVLNMTMKEYTKWREDNPGWDRDWSQGCASTQEMFRWTGEANSSGWNEVLDRASKQPGATVRKNRDYQF